MKKETLIKVIATLVVVLEVLLGMYISAKTRNVSITEDMYFVMPLLVIEQVVLMVLYPIFRVIEYRRDEGHRKNEATHSTTVDFEKK